MTMPNPPRADTPRAVLELALPASAPVTDQLMQKLHGVMDEGKLRTILRQHFKQSELGDVQVDYAARELALFLDIEARRCH